MLKDSSVGPFAILQTQINKKEKETETQRETDRQTQRGYIYIYIMYTKYSCILLCEYRYSTSTVWSMSCDDSQPCEPNHGRTPQRAQFSQVVLSIIIYHETTVIQTHSAAD